MIIFVDSDTLSGVIKGFKHMAKYNYRKKMYKIILTYIMVAFNRPSKFKYLT